MFENALPTGFENEFDPQIGVTALSSIPSEIDDYVVGTNRSDVLAGRAGNDTLFGLGKNDRLLGNQDDDWLFGGNSTDRLEGGSGDDTLYGEQGRDTLRGNDGEDWLDGGITRDFLYGGTGDDTLYGGEGNDEVFGNAGDDLLFGGSGLDTVSGGSGSDTIGLDISEESPRRDDLIIGFNSNEDFLQLPDDLTFEDLAFEDITPKAVVIRLDETEEVLGVVKGVKARNLDSDNFIVTAPPPPTDPLDDLEVSPGGRLEIELSDIFGEDVTFSLQIEEDFPSGRLEGDGTFVITPTPEELGSYDFSVVIKDEDGNETVQNGNLDVVADSLTTTRISGVIENTQEEPLAGVMVEVGSISATTDENGTFTLEFPDGLTGDTLRIEPGQEIDGEVYPSIAEKLPLLFEQDVFDGVNNVITRPIFLPALDIDNAEVINPTVDTLVTTDAIPGASVFVAAGTLENQDSDPFTGALGITEVPRDLTPAALPPNLLPDMLVTIQPGEMVFTQPAPLSMPNIADYPPGTEMDLWSINPQSGEFEVVGIGVVSADGNTVTTTQGGISNSSWHFFAPPADVPEEPEENPRNEENGCEDCKGSGAGTSEVQFHSGAVIEIHDMVSYQSLGTSRNFTLTYDSLRADPRPILHFGYDNVQSDPDRRLVAEFTVMQDNFARQVPGFGGGSFGLDGGEHFWSLPEDDGRIDAALQADLRALPSGVYDYELSSGLLRLNEGTFSGSTTTDDGEILHINARGSSFGHGWGLAGVQELVENDDGSVLLIDGDGSELLFEADEDGGFISPAGDFSTLERLNNGTFRRTMTDQTVYTFSQNNRLVRMEDRNGNITHHIYDATGRLTKIIDPAFLETVFSYSNDRVTAITDPAGRVTELTYDTDGNLVQITDPDGSRRTWDYDTFSHMTAEIDKRGNREEMSYDSFGRADTATRKDGSTIEFDPVQAQGVFASSQTINPLNAPTAFGLGEVESDYTDANGDTTTYTLDQMGQVISAFDDVGLLPTIDRNDDNLITRRTDGRGNATTYTYDENGNVLQMQNALSFLSSGGNALIINGADSTNNPDDTAAATAFLESVFQEAGINTTVVNAVPNDLSGFTQVLDIRYEDAFALTTSEETLYLDFLQGGGSLLLVGENENFEDRNDSILSVVETAGGGALDFVEPGFVQEVVPPFDSPNPISDGNVTYGGIDTGGVSSPGTGQFISVDTTGEGSAVYFDGDDLDNALSGELIIVFDNNFFSDDRDREDNQNLIRNLIGFERTATRYTYDETFNQLTSITDELGRQTLFEIDPNTGNVLSATQVIGAVGGADDLVTEYTYTNRGLINTVTDPLGRVTDYDYNTLGLVTAITFAEGTSDEATRQFEYDAAGNQTAIIDENGNRTKFEYDSHNRLTQMTEADPDGSGPLTAPVTIFTYDENGNLATVTDAEGNTTQNQYDDLNRLTRLSDPLGQITQYEYDALGNIISVIDPLGHETQNSYDERNRLIETTDPDGGVTQFDYDLDDNLTSVIDPASNETTFVYDARNRLTSETDPLGKTSTFEYDLVNNLIAQTDRNGRETQFDYDDIDRLLAETWVGAGHSISYSYDKASNLTSVTDPFSALAFTYDNRDRVLTVDNAGTPDAPTVDLEYTYDDVGNILSVTDTIDGVTSGTNTYSYDNLNRLIELTQSGNGVSNKRVDFGYNALGQFTDINRYADLGGAEFVTGTSYTYDDLNRLANLTHNNGTEDVAFYDYEYDANSRISQITDIDGVTDYTYDDRDQLIGANHDDSNNPDESYGYDANGNRTNSHLHGNDYQTGDGNRLESDGTYTYEYDDEGNLIRQTEIATGTVQEFEWDYRNRLIAVIDKDASNTEIQRVEFTYDALDRRINKTVDTTPQDNEAGETTHFVYDGQDVLLEFVDEDGAETTNDPVLTQRYLHGPAIDQVLAQENETGEVLWLLTDHLGTTKDLVDDTGTVLNHLTYDSFGQVVAETDATVDTRYLFTGREFDKETGLQYNRARYYDAIAGRFISEDPIGFSSGDSNFFRYVFNDPVSFTDPGGEIVPAVLLVARLSLGAIRIGSTIARTGSAAARTATIRISSTPIGQRIVTNPVATVEFITGIAGIQTGTLPSTTAGAIADLTNRLLNEIQDSSSDNPNNNEQNRGRNDQQECSVPPNRPVPTNPPNSPVQESDIPTVGNDFGNPNLPFSTNAFV